MENARGSPACRASLWGWPSHPVVMSARNVQTHLSSSAQHCMQIYPCHTFKGIYHPPKCIHQAKMSFCDHCGFNRHSPGWAGAHQGTLWPKDGLAEDPQSWPEEWRKPNNLGNLFQGWWMKEKYRSSAVQFSCLEEKDQLQSGAGRERGKGHCVSFWDPFGV